AHRCSPAVVPARHVRLCQSGFSPSAFSPAASLLEPANSFRPLARVTERALPLSEPSFARQPETITASPIFIELRVQPRRIKPFGLPSWRAQLSTLPPSAVTSI